MTDSGYYVAKDGGKGEEITDNIYIGLVDGKIYYSSFTCQIIFKKIYLKLENVSIIAKNLMD